jgi:uncharacterized protein YjdB
VDGQIINGEMYDGTIRAGDLLGGITTRTKVTVKAMAVTGMGVAGKVTTMVFTVSPDADAPESQGYFVEITNAPSRLIAGKSLQLQARVIDASTGDEVSKKLTWSISSVISKAKINASSGKLTTSAEETGTLTVTCSTADGIGTTSVEIQVVEASPVGKMTINGGSALQLSFDNEGKVTGNTVIKLTTLTDNMNINLLDGESYKDYSFQWISSNSNILAIGDTVDGQSAPAVNLVPRAAGTVTVTCKALDGSGKSASLKVVVTAQLKASSVSISNSADTAVTALTLYTDDETYVLNSVIRYQNTSKTNIQSPLWSSSNTKVARIAADTSDPFKATLTALSKGTATITCAATDGSGKKASFKLTVMQHVEQLQINGQKYIAPGATAKYTAVVTPSAANNKKVTWDISADAKAKGITVDSTKGTVKVPAGVEADYLFNVTATAADGSGVSTSYEVKISPKATKATVIVAEDESDTIAINPNPSGDYTDTTLVIATFDNGTAASVKSSNTKVARVAEVVQDSTGKYTIATIVAVGKGSCKITATAQDGSKKSGSVKITVKELVSSITVTGQKGIALGGKATYKAEVLGKKANNRKVEWSLKEAVAGVAIDSKGVVTVGQQAQSSAGKTVTVIAKAADGSGIFGSCDFTIAGSKATAISVDVLASSVIEDVHIPQRDAKNVLTSVRLYDHKLTGDASTIENQIVLTSTVTANTASARAVARTWKSSAPSVAEVTEEADGRAVVVGKKPGSATITCTTGDGSGLKASVKVNVITPASGIFIPAVKGVYSDVYHGSELAFGASCTSPATLGSLYGKPSINNIDYDYEVGTYSGSGRFAALSDELNETIRKKGMIFRVSGTGVRLKDKDQYIADLVELGLMASADDTLKYYAVKLTATTTDGTGYEAARYFKAVEATTFIKLKKTNGSGYVTEGKTKFSAYLENGVLNQKKYYKAGVVDFDNSERGFSVVSSDTSVVTPYITTVSGVANTLALFPKGVGTATITISALDGSGVKCVYTFTVEDE